MKYWHIRIKTINKHFPFTCRFTNVREMWYKHLIMTDEQFILKGGIWICKIFLKDLLFCVYFFFKNVSFEIHVYVLAKWDSYFRKTCSINSFLLQSFICVDICTCLILCGFIAKLFLELEVLPFQWIITTIHWIMKQSKNTKLKITTSVNDIYMPLID